MQEVDRRKRKETPENDSTRVWKSCWNLGLEVNSLSWTQSTCLLFFGNLTFSLEKKILPISTLLSTIPGIFSLTNLLSI